MAENQPQLVVLKDLAAIAQDFVCARPFKFRLPEFPEKEYQISIKPLTEALLAKAREFSQFAPPKKKIQKKKEGSDSGEMEEVEIDDLGDPQFLAQVNEKMSLRRAFIFLHGLPEIKFESTEIDKVAKEIQEKFPEPYSRAIENEISRQSTNEVAIINLANFSVSAGSAQS